MVAFPRGVLEEEVAATRRAQGDSDAALGWAVKAIVIGCGRVGSAVAKRLDDEGWDVTAIDEKEEALAGSASDWRGGFVVGHGMDDDVLREAGIAEADAVVVATDGDNTNLVVGAGGPEALRGRLRRRARARPGPGGVLRGPRPAHGLPDLDRDRRAHRLRPRLRGPRRPEGAA